MDTIMRGMATRVKKNRTRERPPSKAANSPYLEKNSLAAAEKSLNAILLPLTDYPCRITGKLYDIEDNKGSSKNCSFSHILGRQDFQQDKTLHQNINTIHITLLVKHSHLFSIILFFAQRTTIYTIFYSLFLYISFYLD